MPTYTLADLRTAQTQDVIAARLVAALGARGLPTASWTPAASGGPELTVVAAVAGALSKLLGAKMASAVGGRLLDLAQGDELTYLAQHFYQLARVAATKTIQNVALFSAPSAPENSFAPGDVWVASSATGRRYVNIDQIDLPPNQQPPFGVAGRFEAEVAGAAYNDPAGTVDVMVTAPAGVSCLNAAPSNFLPARLLGSSTGQIAANGEDPDDVVKSTIGSIRVQIYTTGDVGAAQFRYSLDSGPWVDGGVAPGPPFHFTISVGVLQGARLFFSNGATPSFIAGDTFEIFRGDAIASQGNDQESDDSLRARCRARWASLSLVPTAPLVELWAKQASPEVAKVLVDANPETPGAFTVTVASSAGPASAAALIAVADYIQPRLLGFQGVPAPSTGALAGIAGSPAETVSVKSAVPKPITPGGLVVVPRAQLAAVQQEADRLWLAYLAGLPLGGTVILAELEQQILDAGATTYSGILLNSVNQNVALAANETAVAADGTSLTKNLSWRPV